MGGFNFEGSSTRRTHQGKQNGGGWIIGADYGFNGVVPVDGVGGSTGVGGGTGVGSIVICAS